MCSIQPSCPFDRHFFTLQLDANAEGNEFDDGLVDDDDALIAFVPLHMMASSLTHPSFFTSAGATFCSLLIGTKISSGFARLGWKRSWAYPLSLCLRDCFMVVRKRTLTAMGTSILVDTFGSPCLFTYYSRLCEPSTARVLEGPRSQLFLSRLHSHSFLSIRTRLIHKSASSMVTIVGNSTSIASQRCRRHLHPLQLPSPCSILTAQHPHPPQHPQYHQSHSTMTRHHPSR